MATQNPNKLPALLNVNECALVLRVNPKTILRRARANALKGCTGGKAKGKPYRVSTSQFMKQFQLTEHDLSSVLLS